MLHKKYKETILSDRMSYMNSYICTSNSIYQFKLICFFFRNHGGTKQGNNQTRETQQGIF